MFFARVPLQKKCERYFPLFGDEPMTFGPFKIFCVSPCYTSQHAPLSLDRHYCSWWDVKRTHTHAHTQRHAHTHTHTDTHTHTHRDTQRHTHTHTHTHTHGLIQRHRQTFRPLIKLQRHTDLSQRTVSLLRRCSLSSLLCLCIKRTCFCWNSYTSEMIVDLQYSKSTEQQYRMNLESLRHSWDLLKY